MALSEYITTGLVVFLCSLFIYISVRNRKLPPGPWGLPIFGYYPFLSQNPYEDFEKLSKRYGNVFSFRTVGGKLIVVLNGYKTVKEILVNRSDEFLGRVYEKNLLEWVSDGLGISQEDGPPWKEQRRFFLQSVKNFGFGKLEMEGKIQDEIKLLLNEFKSSEERPTNIYEHIPHTTCCIIAHILFNKRMGKDDALFKGLRTGLEELLQMFIHCNIVSIGWFFEYIVMNYFPGAKNAQMGKRYLHQITNDIVDEHIATFDPNHIRDFVDAYLEHRNKLNKNGELEKSTFTMERLRAIAMNMLMEGIESPASILCSFLEELSKHPDVQKKMQSELDANVGKERMPSWLDRQSLPYLDAVILELYRKATPFNLTTLYSNYKETTIQGYRIPKRSVIIASLWSMNNDPEIYENPSEFRPERFLDAEGKRVKKDGPFSFGVGKRSCIGESLAQMEVFLLIAATVQNFTITATDEEKELKFLQRD